MKILLIDPPYGEAEIGGSGRNFRSALNKIPSLGLAYLAAAAERRGHTVKVADCTFDAERQGLLQAAEAFGPDIVGVTATTPTFRNAVFVAAVLRRSLREAVFICGGAHATACPEDTLRPGVFDFVVLGEGEETFLELLTRIGAGEGGAAEDIRGIAFRRKEESFFTAPRPKIQDLDILPFPARHLFPPLKAYRPTPASYRKLPLAVLITSRGCPSKCSFCDRAVFGETFRQRSVANVMEEVENVICRYGAKEIRFFDDTFTVSPDFVFGICREMKKSKPAVPWTCLTKVTAVTRDMLQAMRESGCWQVLFGLESGDESVLRRLQKGTTVEQNRQAVIWARKAGLRVRADFLVGSPWETKQSLERTIAFAKSLPLDFAHFNKFVPLPGTEIYAVLKREGRRVEFNDACYISNQCEFPYVPPAFTDSEYAASLSGAYREFYMRPAYLLQRLCSIKTATEFIGQVNGARSILSLVP